jgi:DNA polymerase-3 subunit beta
MLEKAIFAVRVRRASLEAGLKSALTCVSSKVSVPILGCVCLEATNDELTIRATDLSQDVRISIPCTLDVPGKIALNARRLYDLVSRLPEGDVRFVVKESHFTAITIEALEATMPGMNTDGFPAAFTPCSEWKASFQPGSLAGQIARVFPTLGTQDDEKSLALESALMRVTPAGVLMVSTDHYRLARTEHRRATSSPEDFEILLPRRLLRTLQSLFPLIGATPVDIGFTPEAVFFRGGNYIVGARRVTGRFPYYESIIPSWRDEVEFSSKELLWAVDRIKGFDDNSIGTILFDIKGTVMELHAQTAGAYESVEQVSIQWTGPDIQFCLKAANLLSCLQPLRDAELMYFGIPAEFGKKKNVPVILTAKEVDPYNTMYLLMPSAAVRCAEERTSLAS